MNQAHLLNYSDKRPLAVEQVVSDFLHRRDFFLELSKKHGSPLYIIEEPVLLARINEFRDVFQTYLPGMKMFFPVKTNSSPQLLATVAKSGNGIEVSSGMELELALQTGAVEIIFNGPAKTDDELILALSHTDIVTVIIDSTAEFERLETLAVGAGKSIRAGIRLCINKQGIWRKFGIPLAELNDFLERASRSRNLVLHGIHFHSSWNMDPSAQVESIVQIGAALIKVPQELKRNLTFIDIGGGFWPPQGEWLPTGPGSCQNQPFHKTVPAAPISEFARQIADALRVHLFPHTPLNVYAEPGRWICNDAAHILLTVAERKGDDIAITDGGTSMVGWERFEHEYFPVINLSRPASEERPFLILGSLCTPHDIWGYSFFGSDICRGDVLLIPFQGAYTYSLRQQFIKPLPRTIYVS